MIRATDSQLHNGLIPRASVLTRLAPPPAVLTKEIATGMRLLGAKSVSELKPEMVELLDGLLGRQL